MNSNNLRAAIETIARDLAAKAATGDAAAYEQLGTLIAMLGGDDEPEPARQPMTAARFKDAGSATRTVTQRRPTGARVAYEVNTGKRGAMPAVPDFAGFRTAEKAWKYISKAKGAVTKPQIEAATGMPGKTVESVVYHLRHAGLIRSVDVA